MDPKLFLMGVLVLFVVVELAVWWLDRRKRRGP